MNQVVDKACDEQPLHETVLLNYIMNIYSYIFMIISISKM